MSAADTDTDRAAARSDLETLVSRFTDGERLDRAARARLVAALARLLAASARTAGAAGLASGRWLVERAIELAPHVPVRDLATLREHHDGRTGDALAESLVTGATRATAAVGAASGALATAEYAAPPLLLAVPVELAAETLAILAIELKLIAELHEVYGHSVPGSGTQRAAAYLTAWARRRGIDPSGPGLVTALSGAARRELRRRLVRRLGRNVSSFAPFLTGAIAGAELNRRETRQLGDAIAADLRH